MIAEAEFFCERSISVRDVHYLCVSKPPVPPTQEENNFFDISTPSPSPIICEVRASESLSVDISLSESVVNFSTSIQTPFVESSTRKFIPRVRSGSHTDKGPRKSNEDEHISIDDLSDYLGSPLRCPLPSAFYAIFDGHGGPEAATYLKNNAMRLFFEDAELPLISDLTDSSLEELENSHRKAFLMADQDLANECNNVCASCGTTALTALVLGGHLLIANAGDCRAVLCRKGVAVQMSQDHRTSSLPERRRVEELGGCIEYGYLNGELSVTRALGDWHMKSLHGIMSPLIAEPEFQKVILTEDDEFLIIGCDGIWDVMSNQEAVSLVRRELRRHDDPKQCAQELVNRALCLHSTDNLTAIIVCFTSRDSLPPQRPRLRCCSLSEAARNRLRSLLQGN